MVMKVKTKIDDDMISAKQQEEDEELTPVSPLGQYLNSSVLSLTLYAVLEFKVPVNDLPISLVSDHFLPISPRFSSIMVSEEKSGVKKWKPVKVNVDDHYFVPEFPQGLSPEEYNECLYNYISKIALEELPQTLPLWQIHKFNYPTSTGVLGSLIFKLHHSLGDGYSLMGALLSCLQRADNPSLPLTLPSRQSSSRPSAKNANVSFFRAAARFPSTLMTSLFDFGQSILKSTIMEDDLTPIRSDTVDGVESRPLDLTNMAFPLDQIKKITTSLKVTINDVMTGVILLGARMYMEAEDNKSGSANSMALGLLNTRDIDGYKSVSEMLKPKAKMPWGNQFAFLHLPIPKLTGSHDPLDFIFRTHQTVKRLKNNYAVFLNAQFLEISRKFIGPEATSKFLQSTMKNSSICISNMIGPVEQMALANHPIQGLYFTASGLPQSLVVTLISYVGTLRATIAVEKGFIDTGKLKKFISKAYDVIFEAAVPCGC
ncbi:wax ester synthase/diacylglycerol acyltransferase 4-like [Apium graveolens]|uniref:wax ester synthase/diacylglycerol acyltransferase 4-like n=1 Tax=Apium graveolens TaxID=4045 RepID=UPI003D7A2AC2